MFKSKIKLNFYPMQLIIAAIMILLPMTIILQRITGLDLFDYLDEVWSIFCIVYVFIAAIQRKINRSDIVFLVVLVVTEFIALLGNIIFGICKDWFAIAVDALSLFKVFLPFIVMKYIGQKDRQMFIAKYMLPFAKLLVLASTLFGILTELGFAHMYKAEERYGLKAFFFIFDSEPRFGYIIACCMLVILLVEKSRSKEIIYSVLCIFNMVLTTKGSVYMVFICYIGFLILWRKQSKMTAIQALPLALATTAASTLQINTYLKDAQSPRMLFLKYGFVTANKYFPLGSGFATYGSDMAKRVYSPLYYEYKFNKVYGMSQKRDMFLTDNYFAMIFGQFGYIGTALFGVLMVIMFRTINNINIYKRAKALTLAMLIGLLISSLGSAIIKMNIGVLCVSLMGLACGYSNHEVNKESTSTRLRIHL